MSATLFRTFYVNWLEKRFQLSDTNGGELVLPPFVKYECIPFKFIIVAPDTDQLSWGKIPVDNLALEVTISQDLDDTTPLAAQTSWSKDITEQSFYGELDLNTALMNAYVGTSEQVTPRLSIVLKEGTARTTIWQGPIVVNGSITVPTYTSPDPLQRYLTADEIDAQYVRWVNAPGRQLILVSEGNIKSVTHGVTDGGAVITQVESV